MGDDLVGHPPTARRSAAAKARASGCGQRGYGSDSLRQQSIGLILDTYRQNRSKSASQDSRALLRYMGRRIVERSVT